MGHINSTSDFNNNQLETYAREYLWHFMTNHNKIGEKPFIITEAKGCMVKDLDGNEYLDATSGGVWAVNVGYGRAEIAEAVANQMKQLSFFALTV